MAKNIKKRSASHIYFGVNKLTGELKHISEVPSGQKCNCICAACLQPFEARKERGGATTLLMFQITSVCMQARWPSIRRLPKR